MGLKPHEVEDMCLWEFNNYMIGYNNKLLRDQEYITTLAYETAAFSNSKKKPKKLEYYINRLRQKVKGKINDKTDKAKADYIEQKIEELKRKRGEQHE